MEIYVCILLLNFYLWLNVIDSCGCLLPLPPRRHLVFIIIFLCQLPLCTCFPSSQNSVIPWICQQCLFRSVWGAHCLFCRGEFSVEGAEIKDVLACWVQPEAAFCAAVKLFIYHFGLTNPTFFFFDMSTKMFKFERLSFVVTKMLPTRKIWTFLNENKNELVELFLEAWVCVSVNVCACASVSVCESMRVCVWVSVCVWCARSGRQNESGESKYRKTR